MFHEPASVDIVDWGYQHPSSKQFALRHVNLHIPQGQRVLLIGASGVGKSTLLHAISGIIAGSRSGQEDEDGAFHEGEIRIAGLPVGQAHGKVGLVLQDPEAQIIMRRIFDNVAFGPENLAVPHEEIASRVQESLRSVGLDHIDVNRQSAHLSGGQQQRLALAGALAMQPSVLALDEPTANLDPQGVTQVVDAVNDVVSQTGATMILVEHRLDPWLDSIDRVVVLGKREENGQLSTCILADGSVDDIFSSPTLNFEELGIWVPERYQRKTAILDDNFVLHKNNAPARDKQEPCEGEIVLRTRDLSIGRAQAIAEHISLEFRAGSITALVGSNGAGKSTLSLTLAGLIPALAGSVEATKALTAPSLANATSTLSADSSIAPASTNPYEWPSKELSQRISYVFQNPEHQFATSHVIDEIKISLANRDLSEEEQSKQAQALLQRFGLADYAERNPYTLSGGEKRRLTVAAALAAQPRVLILDEPTFGQDFNTWQAIVELIAKLRDEHIAIIVVTHDTKLVEALHARVIRLVPQQTKPAAFEHDSSAHAYRASEASQSSTQLSHQNPTHTTIHSAPQNPTHSAVHNPTHPATQTVPVSAVNTRPDSVTPPLSKVLDSMNPAWRMMAGFLGSIPLLFSLDWLSASCALVLEVLVCACLTIWPHKILKTCWPVFIGAPGSAIAVALYGKAGGATWWQFGFIHITDRSLNLALATSLRILAIGIPAIIAVAGINETDFADSLSQKLHLPDRFVYGALAGLRLFGVLKDDWQALAMSRRSRGLAQQSTVRTFVAQSFALLVLSIRRSTMLAVAMEARGFGSDLKRTYARISVVRARDWVMLAVALTIPLVSLAVAFTCGTFAFFGGIS